MRKIAVEEHFFTESYLNYLLSREDQKNKDIIKKEISFEEQWLAARYNDTLRSRSQMRNLMNLGDARLKDMDEAGIDLQVLSLMVPGVEHLDTAEGIVWARTINDELSETIKKHPERFAGFATIPAQEPNAAADELERTVIKLGFKGALINSHVNNEYLDDPKYWVILERAEKLGVPIYIHPREPSVDMIKPYLAQPVLVSAMWGFAAETGLHAMRLICSGVFDKFPDLKIILGHLGESIPFWLWRIDRQWQREKMSEGANPLQKSPVQYFKENFYVTTSGMFWPTVIQFVCSAIGADRVLFATDYLGRVNKQDVNIIESLPICNSDKEKIFHLNAEKLLGF